MQRRSDEGERLLDGPMLAALRGLTLPLRRARGALPGAHPGSQPGRGEDFFQHRAYVRGEDVRAVDWRASARTGHLLVKERHRPLRQPLALLLDRSASMNFPRAAVQSKSLCALRLAAGLATLALRRGDPVTLFALAPSGFRAVGRALPAGRAAEASEALVLRAPHAARADAPLALSRLAPAPLAGSHAVVLSDLYGDEALFGKGLAALARAGVAVSVLHLLCAEEQSLPAAAALRDLETGEERALAFAEAFDGRVAAWRERLRDAAVSAGAELLAVDAGEHASRSLRRWLAGRA